MDDWDDGWDNDGGYDDGNDEGGWQEEGYDEDVVYREYDEYDGEYYGEYDDDEWDVEGFGYEQSSNPLTAPADDDDDYDDWFVWSTGSRVSATTAGLARSRIPTTTSGL
jgi:hypothetical protein